MSSASVSLRIAAGVSYSPYSTEVWLEREHVTAPLCTIILQRPAQRNAVDGHTAQALSWCFQQVERDDTVALAVLYGQHGHFSAGADLKALAQTSNAAASSSSSSSSSSAQAGVDSAPLRAAAPTNPLQPVQVPPRIYEPTGASIFDMGPMGPTRMLLSKPVIAAIDGYCVAGGLELALWCDLRVCHIDSVFGVFCRRLGVPLIDGATVRLPKLIGLSRALDLILTGRPVKAQEALDIGLVNRVVSGSVRQAAEELGRTLCAFPQECLRKDRMSVYQAAYPTIPATVDPQQHNNPLLNLSHQLNYEFQHGRTVIEKESIQGATSFIEQKVGRHGAFQAAQPAQTQAQAQAQAQPPLQTSKQETVVPLSREGASIRCVLFDLGGVVLDSPIHIIEAYQQNIHEQLLRRQKQETTAATTNQHENTTKQSSVAIRQVLQLPPYFINKLMSRSLEFKQLEQGILDLHEFLPLFQKKVDKSVLQVAFKQFKADYPLEAESQRDDPAAVIQSLHNHYFLPHIDIAVLFQQMSHVQPRPDMIHAIQTLKQHGYIVAAITNNWKEHKHDQRGMFITHLDGVFPSIFESCLLGHRKPSAEIFSLALKQLQEHIQSHSFVLSPQQCIFLDDIGANVKMARQLGMNTIKVQSSTQAISELSKLLGIDLLANFQPSSITSSSIATPTGPLASKL